MNIILIKPEEITGNTAKICGARAEHLKKVLKAKEGSVVKAGILNGLMGTAVISKLDGASAELTLTCETEPPKAPEISLVLALPRPKVFRRILFGIACAGVKNIHIINTWRVDKSYWNSPYLEPERIDEYFFDALSQSKDTIMPRITFHRYFMEFIESAVPEFNEENRYFAHPYDSEKSEVKTPCTMVIGCEGGFIDKEVKSLTDCGFKPFSLGDRILTTEYAVPYVLGMLR